MKEVMSGRELTCENGLQFFCSSIVANKLLLYLSNGNDSMKMKEMGVIGNWIL